MASPSWRINRATSAFLPRVLSGISCSSNGSSDGRRRAYSCQPSSTQRGIFEPTAISLIRTAGLFLFARVLCAALLRTLPEAFEVIELARRHLHHMHHHVAQVEQRPLATFQPLATERAYALLLDLLQHVVCQGLHVAAGGTAGNHHEIGDAGLAAYIDGGDVGAFQVFQSTYDQLDQRFILHSL